MDLPESPAQSVAIADCNMVPIRIMQMGKENITVHVELGWNLADLKQKVFAEDVSRGKNIRVIFMGKMLKDSDVLGHSGIKENSVLQVSISDRVAQSGEQDIVNNGADQSARSDVNVAAVQYNPQDFTFQTPEGTNGDFALGFAMGYILGIFMLIWIWQPRVSRKQKLGILAGVTFNTFISYFEHENRSKSQGGSSSTAPTPTPSPSTP